MIFKVFGGLTLNVQVLGNGLKSSSNSNISGSFFFSLTFLDLNISLQWHLLKVKSKSFTKAPAHPTPNTPPVLFCTQAMLASWPLHKLYQDHCL